MKSKHKDYENEDNDGAGFITGLFVGAVLGACAALLYAPMSGEETRQGIKDVAEKQKDNLKNQWDQTKEKAMDKASEIVNTTKDKIDSFGEQAKGAKKVLTGIVVNGCIVPVYGVNILIFLARLSSDQSSGFDILKTKTTETFKSQGHR